MRAAGLFAFQREEKELSVLVRLNKSVVVLPSRLG